MLWLFAFLIKVDRTVDLGRFFQLIKGQWWQTLNSIHDSSQLKSTMGWRSYRTRFLIFANFNSFLMRFCTFHKEEITSLPFQYIYLPSTCHYNPLLIMNCTEKWVKNIEAAYYNGERVQYVLPCWQRKTYPQKWGGRLPPWLVF